MSVEPAYSVFGDHAILLDWPAQISDQCHQLVKHKERMLISHFDTYIVETVSTYHSIAVYLQKHIEPEAFITSLKGKFFPVSEVQKTMEYVLTIPVCYDATFALDMDEVAKATNCSPHVVIELHTRPIYKMYFMGFLPGFPYLGGLVEELHMPRIATPRLIVEKGSVGIGGIQTGIYPSRSPGGWNIIGRTPITIFDIRKSEPSIFNQVDFVKFRAISLAEFELISTQLSSGKYIPEKEVWHG